MAYSDAMWAEAKKKCRLNNEDIALAKRLGPQSAQPDQKYPQQKRTVESPGEGLASRDG